MGGHSGGLSMAEMLRRPQHYRAGEVNLGCVGANRASSVQREADLHFRCGIEAHRWDGCGSDRLPPTLVHYEP